MPARRDFLKLAAAGMTAAALHKWLPTGAEGSASPPLIWRGSSRHRYVALTYDDCYLVKRLQGLEALLAEFPDFKITLFPVGVALLNNEQKDPGIWKRFHAQGHEIGYHSWDHTNFGVMSEQTALEDYARWLEALTKVLGETPSVHFGRPTFGSLSPSFDAVCKTYGLVNTMWSTGWGGELSVGLNAAKRSRNGDIVLMHIRTQDYDTSVEAYPWMKENGWGAVTLSRLYDDLLRESNESSGCDAAAGPALTRTCIE
ncbi:MAG TPA: polysaccharide deacetylase family protein [Anaerolineales bacterium]